MTLTKILIKCVDYAASKHRLQLRKDLITPYINHPIGLARILTEEAHVYDLNTIQAAMLHDTVEDTDATFQDLTENFGVRVAEIVAELTDDMSLASQARRKIQIENAPRLSREAKIVRLADKLYNLRDLTRARPVYWTRYMMEDYQVWSKDVVDGLRGTNVSMEMKLDDIFRENNLL